MKLPGHLPLAGLLVLVFGLGLFVLPSGSAPVAEPPAAEEPPRLAVLVFFDQLRGDYLTRWDVLFGAGGFRRLEKDGAWFINCHYPYSDTVTAAGHASVSTGCSPRTHGIIGNDWYDRAAGSSVYCVGSDRYPRVPPAPPPLPRTAKEVERKKPKGISPERLLAPTLADALKEATGGKGRVVALSLKDRSAVLPGGRQPDACYWWDTADGQFVTSTYYRDRLHSWASEFNRSGLVNKWMGTKWNLLRPELDYERYSGPDDAAGEGTRVFRRTFPHALGVGGNRKKRTAYYEALFNSPFGNDLLLVLARRAIEAEELGRHDAPDLLSISFSSNDAVGHCWGPDSQEVLDVTLRTDRIVAQLLDILDTQVGKGRYVLALTADHGICPLPEAARKRGRDAGRIDAKLLVQEAGAFLGETFGVPSEDKAWVEDREGPWLYLNRAFLARHGLGQSEVEAALAGWLKKQPGVRDVYTRNQLLTDTASEDAVGRSVRQSFCPERSGDVRIIEKPYYLLTTYLTGTSHGTPNGYDTHVPLLVYGPGVRPGVRRELVTPQTAPVILAKALGIQPPARAVPAVPADLSSSR